MAFSATKLFSNLAGNSGNYFLESKTVFFAAELSSHVSSTILRWNDGSILSNNAEPFN